MIELDDQNCVIAFLVTLFFFCLKFFISICVPLKLLLKELRAKILVLTSIQKVKSAFFLQSVKKYFDTFSPTNRVSLHRKCNGIRLFSPETEH